LSTLHTRKPLRVPGYDYSTPGFYMVTICVHHMECRFGEVRDGRMHLSTGGEIADRRWRHLPTRIPAIALDTYVVMPNHIHGIIEIQASGNDPRVSLSDVVLIYKSLVATEYSVCVQAGMFPPYDRSLWLRGFQDRIIRDDRMLDTLRAYIEGNPGRWTEKYG